MSKDGLKDEHEKFYEIINTMLSGFVKLRINDDGTTTVVFVNSTFLGMTDMTEEEFRKLYDVDCLAGVHPDDILRLKEMMDNIHVGEEMRGVYRLRKGKSDWIWVSAISHVIKEDGEMIMYNNYLDVSDEKEKSFMLDRILNNLPGGVAVFKVAEKLECQYFSEGFVKLLGYPRDELEKRVLEGTMFEQSVYPPDLNKCISIIRTLSKEQKPIKFNYRAVSEDGNIFWINASASIIRTENSCPVYYCVFTTPPDESNLYSNIVENAADGVAVIERLSRRIIYINKRMKEIYRLPTDRQMTGRLLFDVLPPDGVLLTENEVMMLSKSEYTEYHRTFNDRYYHIRAKALDWNDADSYVIYVSDDTYEQEKHIKQQELIDLVPAGIGIYEIANGRARQEYMNEGFFRMIRFSKKDHDEHFKGNFMLGVHPDDVETTKNLIADIAAGKNSGAVEFRNLCGDGTYLWVRLVASVISRITRLSERIAFTKTSPKLLNQEKR